MIFFSSLRQRKHPKRPFKPSQCFRYRSRLASQRTTWWILIGIQWSPGIKTFSWWDSSYRGRFSRTFLVNHWTRWWLFSAEICLRIIMECLGLSEPNSPVTWLDSFFALNPPTTNSSAFRQIITGAGEVKLKSCNYLRARCRTSHPRNFKYFDVKRLDLTFRTTLLRSRSLGAFTENETCSTLATRLLASERFHPARQTRKLNLSRPSAKCIDVCSFMVLKIF